MNPYVKRFLHRGLVFGGFGPLVMGIVYWCLSLTLGNIALSGGGDIATEAVNDGLCDFSGQGKNKYRR